MVSVRKRKVGNGEFYYLEHSIRSGSRVEKKEKYLGKELPRNLDEIKRVFMSEIFRERWFGDMDKIKERYRKEYFSPSVRKKKMQTFAVRFTYNTNRIEGSRLTLRETQLLLERGISPSAKPVSDVKEAEAHRDAFYEMLDYKKDISLDLILYFHGKLFESTKKDIAGKLRRELVEISGSRFKPPLAVEVYPLLMDFLKWYRKNKNKHHPVELAALVHLKLVTIHPFTDGNGRVSRLMMNLLLNRHGFPMLDIAYEKRAGYYNALERSQVKKDEYIFLQWFLKRYLMENRKYLDE